MAAIDLLTVPEAAERMGVSVSGIYMAVHKGKLPAFRVPCPGCSGRARLLIPADALDAYNARRRKQVSPEIRARILALGAAGLGVSAVARMLNREGIPAPGGGEWQHGTVRRLLVA